MGQALEELLTSGKEFSSSSLNVQGYSIIEVSKSKASDEKFKNRCKFFFTPDHLVNAVENKGKVYAYMRKGEVKALYVINNSSGKLICEEYYYSDDIAGEPIADLMDCQVAFLMADRIRYMKEEAAAVFKGTVLPKLIRKSGGYNWGFAIIFSMLYSTMFSQGFKNTALAFSGIGFGIAMGACFAIPKYNFEVAGSAVIEV